MRLTEISIAQISGMALILNTYTTSSLLKPPERGFTRRFLWLLRGWNAVLKWLAVAICSRLSERWNSRSTAKCRAGHHSSNSGQPPTTCELGRWLVGVVSPCATQGFCWIFSTSRRLASLWPLLMLFVASKSIEIYTMTRQSKPRSRGSSQKRQRPSFCDFLHGKLFETMKPYLWFRLGQPEVHIVHLAYIQTNDLWKTTVLLNEFLTSCRWCNSMFN